jgi:hypothetical protein
LFQQISDQPLGFMDTGHPYGIRVQHLGSGPGIVTGFGFPCADRELSSRDMDWSGDTRTPPAGISEAHRRIDHDDGIRQRSPDLRAD